MNNVFEPEYLIGACQFFRREAYLEAGPLDENIFYGPEDADFCLRIRKKGGKYATYLNFPSYIYANAARTETFYLAWP